MELHDGGLHRPAGGYRDPRGPARDDLTVRPPRLAGGLTAVPLLAALAGRRERISYSDFAFSLGLGSPRGLGWLLSPLLGWCRATGLPWLPILVVRRADGLPSGGYEPDRVASETERVFAHDWSAVRPPGPGDLVPFALPRPHRDTSRAGASDGVRPC